MSVAPKRGIKRKRGPEEPSKDVVQPYKKAPVAPEIKFRTKLHHGVKEVKKAAKIAKTREMQRLVKRLKELRTKEDQMQAISVIEEQLEGLKNLNHESIAVEMLSRRLQKDKHIQSNDQVKAVISNELERTPASRNGTNETNLGILESRISSSKVLAAPVGDLVAALRALILPRKTDHSQPDKATAGMELDAGGEEGGWESGSISGDDQMHSGSGADEPNSTAVAHISLASPGDISSVETSNSEDEDVPADSRAVAPSKTDSTRKMKSDFPVRETEDLTFLPTLAVGYTRGDSSASDWSGEDGGDDDKADPTPRKNRRGQRARKAIWEKKYGKNANHVKKQKEEEAAEEKKMAERRNARAGKRYGKPGARGVISQAELENRPKDSGWSKSQEPTGSKAQLSLHPSWDAAKKRKAMPMVVPSEGKKIVF